MEEMSTTTLPQLIATVNAPPNLQMLNCIGDLSQFGPVIPFRKEQEFSTLLEKSAFAYLAPDQPSRYHPRLDRNYRSHPDILRLFNGPFYGGKLQPVPSTSLEARVSTRFRQLSLQRKLGEGLSTIHQLCKPEDAPRSSCINVVSRHAMTKARSCFNLDGIVTIVDFVKRLLEPATRGGPADQVAIRHSDIVVSTAYAADKTRIERLLVARSEAMDGYGLPRETLSSVLVMTVDSFQGREAEIIIGHQVFGQDTPGWITDPNRANVKLSRAKSLFIDMGNFTFLKKYGYDSSRDRKFA